MLYMHTCMQAHTYTHPFSAHLLGTLQKLLWKGLWQSVGIKQNNPLLSLRGVSQKVTNSIRLLSDELKREDNFLHLSHYWIFLEEMLACARTGRNYANLHHTYVARACINTAEGGRGQVSMVMTGTDRWD